MHAEIKITHYTDNALNAIVSVPLSNSAKQVHMYQDDFNSLIEMGLDARWKLLTGQIVERGRSRLSIARLIVNAGKGDQVRFLDQDCCNLKRENIIVTTKGNGKSKVRDKLTGLERINNPPTRFNKAILKHEYINPRHIERTNYQ